MKVDLNYGSDDPLVIDSVSSNAITEIRGPEGVDANAAVDVIRDALLLPIAGPPLSEHVVPGDRVIIAQAGDLPGGTLLADSIYSVIVEILQSGGVSSDDVQRIIARPTIESDTTSFPDEVPDTEIQNISTTLFNRLNDSDTAYLSADETGEPLHLARAIVDADVVLSIGSFGYDASLRGRSPEGELWPSFARQNHCQKFIKALLKKRQLALHHWRDESEQITAQLGILASLRLVCGNHQTLAGAAFGFPAASITQSRLQAKEWRPTIPTRSPLAIAGIPDRPCRFVELTRAIAAAARVTTHDGTICIACNMSEEPGIIFTRWRHGVDLPMLLREASDSEETALLLDALHTSLFAKALGDRRLVLLSQLDQNFVEDLDIGHAETPDAINRLIQQSESACVLHEANRLCPTKS
ncbi:MAG: DUF2088 domain-containing protein [Planctomycetaceae bacterium]|nr:DUF2088 domain-containing protein [Planctomycetaceae bacterium]